MLCVLFFFGTTISFGQKREGKKDSTTIANNITSFSKKNKFNKILHKLVFKRNTIRSRSTPKIQKKYSPFEGKIIRKINIITLDPFGYSDTDTLKKPTRWAEKVGNRAHIKTSRLAILNLLLIKKNKAFDSLLVRESERLIRAQRYINRVDITPDSSTTSPDSVDVTIRVLDSWSMLPQGSLSSSRINFELNERNFLGSGHQFQNKITNRFEDGKTAYDVGYRIPTIKNTFVSTDVKYRLDLDGYYNKSVALERPFYSPVAKWAGGIFIEQNFRKDTLPDVNSVFEFQNFKFNTQDFWVGRAFQIFKGQTVDDRSSKLVLSGRFLNIQYSESPSAVFDPDNFYANEKLALIGLGITSRRFVRDRYIFQNGIIEDVPTGKTYGLTAGYQNKNQTNRFYAGARAAFGHFFEWGFLSTNIELGSFFDGSKTQQSAFTFEANYFTNLMSIGKWKVRQFIKPQIVLGAHRSSIIGDQLSINQNEGISGFNTAQYGTQKALVVLQTQAYSPWKLWGFRLNPYLNYSLATLGNSNKSILSSKAYSKLSVGFIINNDYLVFSAFQISLSYYPSIPGNGTNIFKTNELETTDFRLQDFDLAKPRIVNYRL